MLSTPHTVSHTTLETGSADALRAAVAELRGTVDALARTLAEMERKVVRAAVERWGCGGCGGHHRCGLVVGRLQLDALGCGAGDRGHGGGF